MKTVCLVLVFFFCTWVGCGYGELSGLQQQEETRIVSASSGETTVVVDPYTDTYRWQGWGVSLAYNEAQYRDRDWATRRPIWTRSTTREVMGFG